MKYAVVFALALVGCVEGPDLAETRGELSAENGQNLNGQNLNGQNLNGQNLNGQNLNGPDTGTFTIWTSLLNAKSNGRFGDLHLEGSELVGNGARGTSLVNAELLSRRGDGSDVRTRIASVLAPALGSTRWRYVLDYREVDGNWYPVCPGRGAAIALAGTWDYRQGVPGGGSHTDDATKVTFACEHVGALAKCVDDGYEPWSFAGTTSLAKHHQACVRLLRGDYCGDGTPYTQNGNRVNLYDGLGIQTDTEDWFFEAEWDEAGARCFSPLNRSHAGVPCYNARVTLGCGSQQFSLGTLLVDETPTAGLTP